MPALELKRVQFFSHADESAFFTFARSIKAVQKIEHSGDSVTLHVIARPSQQSLRDLVALFVRYRIGGMPQLAQFLSSTNRRWFADPRKVWHKKVFGNGTRTV
jgi:hypothetical protein